MCKYTRGHKGFTILELLVVIVIIGILAAMALPKYMGVREDANVAVSKSNLKSLQTAVERYCLDNGVYPSAFSDLVTGGYAKNQNCYIPSEQECYGYGFNQNDYVIMDVKNDLYVTSNGIESDFSTYTGTIVPAPQTL